MNVIDRVRLAVGEQGYTVMADADFDAMMLEICRLSQIERRCYDHAGEEHY